MLNVGGPLVTNFNISIVATTVTLFALLAAEQQPLRTQQLLYMIATLIFSLGIYQLLASYIPLGRAGILIAIVASFLFISIWRTYMSEDELNVAPDTNST